MGALLRAGSQSASRETGAPWTARLTLRQLRDLEARETVTAGHLSEAMAPLRGS